MLKTTNRNPHSLKTLYVMLGLVVVSLFMTFVSINSVQADIIPPRHQMKIGIPSEDIVCDTGLFKVIRENTNSVACVKPDNVVKLVSAGWAKKVDEKLLVDVINRKSVELGTINIIEKIPIRTNVGKLASGTPISGYDIVFEVCASTPIYAADILIRSDSEKKRYELVETVETGACVISASEIKAANEKTITVSMLNQGDISQKVLSLQSELNSLKQQLVDAKQSFKDPKSPDAQRQGIEIAEIRKQVNDKREELYRLLFTIHSPQTVKQKLEKLTFSGNVIEGESATILSIMEAIRNPGQYDVIFEACAGSKTIRLPVVTINSDIQKINVKLGDKISANTCQMTSAKIEAVYQSSISIVNSENTTSSNRTAELEVLIGSLQNELVKEKQSLKSLVHDSNRADNFTEQLDAQVTKIVELRNQITNAKAELNKILYMTYN